MCLLVDSSVTSQPRFYFQSKKVVLLPGVKAVGKKREFLLINYHHKLYRLKPFIHLDLRTYFKFQITYFYDFSKKMELGLRIKYE